MFGSKKQKTNKTHKKKNNNNNNKSTNIQELDPAFADMPIVRKRIDNAKVGTVLSNSFGFGGTNATLEFKRLDA